MSNTQYLGTNCGFYHVPTSGTTWVTYPIPVPLREVRPGYRVRQYVADSLDYSVRQVLQVPGSNSTGFFEAIATIRYANDSSDTQRFLKSAVQGRNLRYTTALTTGTTDGSAGPGTDVVLTDLGDGTIEASLDRQRGSGFEDLEIVLRFRRASGADAGTVESSGDFSDGRWW